MPTAFVTGASRRIGGEFVRQYRNHGWCVIANCRDPAGSGPAAFVSVEASVQGMRDIIDRWTPADAGAVVDHTGRTIPW
jgi:NAD(P)-dependent dehydrogenase (short-subunit alcohol dehydrogenase family)